MLDLRTFVIAEAGVNHNGSLDLARDLVRAAARAGADAVKFQSFRAAHLVTRSARKAQYQDRDAASQTQFEMLQRLELSREAHIAIMHECRVQQIQFMSTPFDNESLDLLVDLGVDTMKISSGELTNLPFLHRVGAAQKPTILSTGMGSMDDVALAVGAFWHGWQALSNPGVDAFRAIVQAADPATVGSHLTLLHCTSAYPTPLGDVNLRAMQNLRQFVGDHVGFSDHSEGNVAAVVAVAMGATIIEKHFTLDKSMAGPDHAMSLDPDELQAFVRVIREAEVALGQSQKSCHAIERDTAAVARKSIVVARDTVKGEMWTADRLTIKRPGTGLAPQEYWRLLGKMANRDYGADELVDSDQ